MKNKNIRVDYNLRRNTKIYDEYVSGKSYNDLSKKYELSPQRIAAIVKEVKGKSLHKKLTVDMSQKNREEYKDLAVKMREQGSLKIAKGMFEDILNWDQTNKNVRGEIGVLGHLAIVNESFARSCKSTSKKEFYLNEAKKYAETALKLSKDLNDVGYISTSSVHYTSVALALSMVNKEKYARIVKEAVQYIDKALKNFPGSETHKAWAMKAKAESLVMLGNYKEAFMVLNEAELRLVKGYNDELKETDGKLKLQVWLTGIWLTKSYVCVQLKKTLLAEMYAKSVLQLNNDGGILNQRRKAAKLLISTLQ